MLFSMLISELLFHGVHHQLPVVAAKNKILSQNIMIFKKN
jgi:hypothetical protein